MLEGLMETHDFLHQGEQLREYMYVHSLRKYLFSAYCVPISILSQWYDLFSSHQSSVFYDILQTYPSNMKAWVFEKINKSVKYIKMLYYNSIQKQTEY